MAKKPPPPDLVKIKHTIYDVKEDREISEDLLALPQKQDFSVSAAASACGLTVDQFRELIKRLASNAKLTGYVNLRVTQTNAHQRPLSDKEPYEILQRPQVERLKLTKEEIKALPYLDLPDPVEE